MDRGRLFFVTRMKENTVYKVVEQRKPPKNLNILSDRIVRLAGVKAATECPHLLRRVVVWDAEKGREIVLLTNHLDFGALRFTSQVQHRYAPELRWASTMTSSILMIVSRYPVCMQTGYLAARLAA